MSSSASAVQKDYLTISALIERSGAHRQTVHYYLRKGLLPPPLRTSRTSALYPPHTVELIHLVRAFQEEKRYRLDEIATLFRRSGYDSAAIRRALDENNLRSDLPARLLSVDQVATALEPPATRDWVESLMRDGLVTPEVHEGRTVVSTATAELIEVLWEWTRAGFSANFLRNFGRQVEKHAEDELAALLEALGKLPPTKDGYVRLARLYEGFERLVAHRRRAAVNARLVGSVNESMNRIIRPNRARALTSQTFLSKMGLYREIDRLLVHTDQHPSDVQALRELARAYHLASDWVHLEETAKHILRLASNDDQAFAWQGQALNHLGRYNESVAVLERGLRVSRGPLLKYRLSQTLLYQARATGDAQEFFQALLRKTRLCSEALAESKDNPALSRKIRTNLAVDAALLSDPLGNIEASTEQIESIYRELKNFPDKNLKPLARISLAVGRIYTTFALYVARKRQGHADAERLRREIVQMDPDGLLAARSNRTTPTEPRRRRS